MLNNLLTVNQHGTSSEAPRQRSFTYDSLSRLLTSRNPETGKVCYGIWSGGSVGLGTCQNGYDANGNLVTKTDARGVVTTNSYDTLNRLLAKTYSSDPSGTLSSCYQYDSSAYALTHPNLVGQLAKLLDSEWGLPGFSAVFWHGHTKRSDGLRFHGQNQQ